MCHDISIPQVTVTTVDRWLQRLNRIGPEKCNAVSLGARYGDMKVNERPKYSQVALPLRTINKHLAINSSVINILLLLLLALQPTKF